MGELDKLPDIMTVQELADYLKLDKQTIWRHIKGGKLVAHKYGKHIRIEKSDIIKWREDASR